MRHFFWTALLASCVTQVFCSSCHGDSPLFRKDYILDEQKNGWFKLHLIADTWQEARDRCELEGAELASPLTTCLYDAMKELIKKTNSTFFYTGIHSTFSYGDYYSIKGVPLSEMAVTESRFSIDNNQRCVILNSNGEIFNTNCNDKYPYVCYRNNDGACLTQCGTIDTGLAWYGAFKACSAEGGHLLVINSIEELREVTNLLSLRNVNEAIEGQTWFDGNPLFRSSQIPGNGGMNNSALVGVIDWQWTGEYVTIHGEKIAQLSDWKAPYFDDRRCGALNTSGKLITVPCSGAVYRFICEKVPDSLITYEQLRSLQDE